LRSGAGVRDEECQDQIEKNIVETVNIKFLSLGIELFYFGKNNAAHPLS
jgi:hypothetical protein